MNGIIDILAIVVGLIAIVGITVFFWSFGHRGTWGYLVKKYPDKRTTYSSFFNSESILVFQDGKWEGWASFQVSLQKEGLYLTESKLFTWLIPSVFIPLSDIKKTKKIKKYFRSFTAVSVDGDNYLLAVRSKHFN